MDVKTVTVLGANGTMGCNVAGIFASFGGARVFLVSRDIKDSKEACERAGRSVRAGSIERNLVPADFSVLDRCVSESDLVFESVSENMASKVDVWGKVAKSIQPGTITCTGTSGLSINTLACVLPEACRGYFTGMHFFNPPYAMRLCELCPSDKMDPSLVAEVRTYLESVLLRTVVEVSDAPAFLANRIGFEFINRAMQLSEENAEMGGIDYVDSLLGPFSGRALAPLNTADFVGLDVHKAIVDNVYVNAVGDVAHDSFALPAFCQHLVKEGHLGRKTKGFGGLYRLDRLADGSKVRMAYDVAAAEYRPVRSYDMPFADAVVRLLRVGDYSSAMGALVADESQEARTCLSMLCEYVVYSLVAAGEISGDSHSADDVMAIGFNWCPPLAMAIALSLAGDLHRIVESALRSELLERIDLGKILSGMPDSKYDYRRYFRASR